MAKKPSLADAMKGASTAAAAPAAPVTSQAAAPQQTEAAAPETEESQEQQMAPYVAPSRKGKTAVTGYLDPRLKKELKILSIEIDKTVEKLLDEAIRDLLLKHNRPNIFRE